MNMTLLDAVRWRVAEMMAQRGLTEPVQQVDGVALEDGRGVGLHIYFANDQFMVTVDAAPPGFDEREFAAAVFQRLCEPEVRH